MAGGKAAIVKTSPTWIGIWEGGSELELIGRTSCTLYSTPIPLHLAFLFVHTQGARGDVRFHSLSLCSFMS